MRRSSVSPFLSLAVIFILACAPGLNGPLPPPAPIRLTPVAVEASAGTDVAALFDRDTTTSLQLSAPVTLTFSFAREVEVRSVKVFGARALSVALAGQGEQVLDAPDRWMQAAQSPAGKLRQWTMALAPSGASAGLAEIELWGVGLGSAPRGGNALAVASAGGAELPFDNAFAIPSGTGNVALQPAGTDGARPCASLDLATTLPLRSVRRAYFAYEAAGVQRSIVLRRSLDGAAAAGGMWLGGGNLDRNVVDELDPRKLTGADSIQLCLPDNASQSVFVASPRLLLEMDDGSNLLDRDGQARLVEAFDGQPDTVAQLATDPVSVSFSRAFALDYAGIDLAAGPLKMLLRPPGGPGAGPPAHLTLDPGWNSLVVPAAAMTGIAFELDPLGKPTDGLQLAEIALVGSPVGRPDPAPRIVVTYPPLRWSSGQFVGERFGEQAFVTGWAESPAGPGVVTIGGAPVSTGNGAFSSPLARPPADVGTAASWKVTLTARFPDGSTLSRDLYLDDDHQGDLLAENVGDPVASDDTRFGAENDMWSGTIDGKKGGKVKLGTDVAVDAPPGAVNAPTSIGIMRHRPEAVPPLDAAMVNVTAPAGAGYRFTPHGQVFLAAVSITLPYDDTLLPEGTAADDVRTYFYDEPSASWQPLLRTQANVAGKQIVSQTTHFTFMVNAVLIAPDHPAPTSFNPTSIKDLKAADPSAGIDFIEPPFANSQGTAHLSLPLRLPPGRGSYKPALSLVYDSQSTSGWTGIGWDLTCSKIAVDTKYGAPFYDGLERYALDGQQLVPVGSASCLDGAPGKRYAARAEGSFDLIVRCGADPASFHFERIDRSGTLFVYGVSPEARLASPRTGDIGSWHLERVVDPNGNLTRYIYELDQKHTSGTAFDAATGEDFRQSYLAEIHYSGRAPRLGVNALSQDTESGAYAIIFQRQRDGSGRLADRPDVVTTARTGFKIVTRHLLDHVQVWQIAGPATQTGIVREYALHYEAGAFGKSRLASVEVFGRGGVATGSSFYRHRFSYTSVQPGFGTPVAWTFDRSDDRAISSTAERNIGVHAYAGISLGPLRDEGSVGFSVSTNHRDSTTEALLLDLNGDGLPDRITHDNGQLGVKFNQSQTGASGAVSHSLSALAPPGDPFGGGTLTPFPSPIPTLGSESGDNFNFGLQTVFGPVFANVGGSFNFSSSDAFLIDADGDGLPDFVGGGQVLFNFPRSCSGPGCCPAGQFCFGTTKPLGGSATFTNLADTASLLSGDTALGAARRAVRDQTPPNDAMLEWTAPFEGTVNLSGEIGWAHSPPTGPGRDGVRLRLYQAREDGTMDVPGQPIFEARRLPTDVAPTVVSVPNLSVLPHDRIYFVLSTLDDFPVGSDATQSPPRPVPLEEITFAPTLEYTACTGDCGTLGADDAALVDPTGAPLFTFNSAADFKLAGSPLTAVQAAFTGTLHVSGDVDKQASTADDVRVCAQRFPFGQPVPDFICGTSSADVTSASIGADFVGRTPFVLDLQILAGDSLVFRIDTELPIDPAAIVWSPTGAMTSICDASGLCHTPLPAETASTTFIADPYFRLHRRYEPIPLRPLLVPHAGTLSVSSSAVGFSGSVAFSVRTQGRLLLKHHAGEEASTTFAVTAGEQIFFEAHAETDPGFRTWPVSVALDGELFIVPLHVTFDQPRAPVMPSPFGGGFHGWRYGTWNGTAADVFDSTVFYRPVDAITFAGFTDHDRALDAKRQFRDPNNPVSQRARLFSTMVPRRRGTQSNASPGLAPVPAFVSQDGTAFVTQQTMHAGRRGGFASPGGQSQSTQGLFAIGDISRASSGQTISGGIGINLGITSLSLSISSGSSAQKLDVRDMNGDGIIDVASDGSGVRLTHLNTLTTRPVPPELQSSAPFSLQQSSDLSVSAGLGFSEPFRDASARGEVRGLYAMFPSSIGGGLAANLSAVDTQLIDVNGDGLPDQVRMDRSTHQLMVRLNLGTSFAENEDALPGASWSSTAGFDPFSEGLQGQVGGLTPGDDDESSGQGGALGVLDKLADPNVVRRSTAVTLELNAGFVFEEEFGATVNFESTLNGTSVELIDVTGDGLPDYVRKSAGDDHFTVRVNTGFGFGPEQRWPVSAWPVQKPQLRLPISALQTVVNDLGFGGGADGIEATATNTAIPSIGFAASVTIPLSPIGEPWLILSTGGDVSPRKLTGFELALLDIDGDGLPDHVLKIESGNASSQSAVYARLNQNGGANLLTHVDEPLGGSFDIAYARTGNTVAMPENRYVVTAITVHDGQGSGTGHDLTSLMRYAGGLHDRNERDFFGFATVETVRSDGSLVVQRYLNDSYRRKGLLASEELRDPSGALFNAVVNIYDDQPALVAGALDECRGLTPFFLSGDDYCSAAWTRLSSSEKRFYEGQTAVLSEARITTAQRFQYDVTTGNMTAFEDLGDVADPADDFSATMDYFTGSAASNLHAIDRPQHIAVFAGSLASRGQLLRERSATFDAFANMSQLSVNLGNGSTATTDLVWNGDGNLQRITSPPNANGERYTVDYGYDPTSRSFVTAIGDAFGYSSSADYDLGLAEALSTTDVNGNSTFRTFDPFGRLVRAFGPSDPPGSALPTLEITYAHQATPASALTANKLPQPKRNDSKTLDTVIFMDGLRRVVQTRTDAEVHGAIGTTVSGRLDFDAMGRAASQGQATFSLAPKTAFVGGPSRNPTTFLYDVLGRSVLVTAPDGSTTATRYAFGTAAGDPTLRFRVAVTDAEGRLHASFHDGGQRVSAVEERIEGRVPTTRYLYDPLGQLTTVIDAAGNRTALGYDLAGRATRIATPDSGLTEFTYDAAGDLIAKVDPNLRSAHLSVSYVYQFNRVVRVVRPISGDITFEYGQPPPPNARAPENGAARIVRIVDEAGEETRGYGRLGEVVRTTRTLIPLTPGNVSRTFETRFAFDSFGRMLQMTYPDGEVLSYGYDGAGLVNSAVGVRPATAKTQQETETYLASMEYDEFGARVAMRLGNGVVTRYAYDPLTRRLAALDTVTPPNRTLQALTYNYDRVGNILDVVNGLAKSTPHRSGPVSLHYQYDALDRLVLAQGAADARPGLLDRFTASFSYSDIHNLTRNLQVRELVNTHGGSAETPPKSNHDFTYLYQGTGPHQATAIGDLTLSYDPNGNTSVQCRAGRGVCAGTVDTGTVPASHDHLRRYDWAEDNLLRQVVDGGGNNATRFLYDSSGQRVVKFGRGGPSLTIGQFFSVQGAHHASKHVFAGSIRLASKLIPVSQEVALFNPRRASASAASGCLPGGTGPQGCQATLVAAVGPRTEPLRSETYYYHPDHLGSTSWVTDHAGLVHEHVEYFPYGDVWRDSRRDNDPGPAPKPPSFLFTSKEFDEETRLTYFGGRYYDSGLAHWTANDPAVLRADLSSPHLLSGYLYGAANPVRFADPDGRSIIDVAFVVWDVATFIKEPSWTNAAFVAVDIITLATPLPSAGAVRAGVKGLEALNEAHKAAEVASTARHVAETTHVVETSAKAVEGARAAEEAARVGEHAAEPGAHAVEAGSATKEAKPRPPPAADNYRGRYNASRAEQGKPRLPEDWDAHHRVPKAFENHPEYAGFDFHAPENIKGVEGSRASQNVHQRITNDWEAFRAKNPNATRAQIEEFARGIDTKYTEFWFK
jgi:RHS repeat-associated protein